MKKLFIIQFSIFIIFLSIGLLGWIHSYRNIKQKVLYVTKPKVIVLDKCTDLPVAEKAVADRGYIVCGTSWSGKGMALFYPADISGRIIGFDCQY